MVISLSAPEVLSASAGAAAPDRESSVGVHPGGNPPGDAASSSRRILSGPAARLLAQRQGVSLSCVRGTGPKGRLLKHDVVLAAAHDVAPYALLEADCRVDRLVSLRAQLSDGLAQPLSLNDLILRAVAFALREVPGVNVAWSASGVVHCERVDLAIAASTSPGPMAPVIRDVDNKSLLEISAESRALDGRAREGQLRTEQLVGGAFGVSYLGMFGVDEFAAIMNPRPAGVLAVAAPRAQPVVDGDGKFAVGKFMHCTLAVDPRAVDGAVAATWLAVFRRLVESPLTLLI